MKEGFKYVSEPGGKRPRLFVFLFLALAVVSAFAPKLLTAVNPVFFQVVMLGSLVVAVYILVRYITTSFVYEVMYEEQTAYLLVIQKQGRRLFTKCKLPLSTLGRIIEVTPDRPLPPDAAHPILNYSSVMMEESYTVLEFRGEPSANLRIHANEAFVSALRAAAAEQARAEEEAAPYDPAAVYPEKRALFTDRATSPFSLTEEELSAGKAPPTAPGEDTPPTDPNQ